MAPDRKNRYGWASHAIALARRVRSWALPAAEYYRGASYGVSSAKAFCAQHG